MDHDWARQWLGGVVVVRTTVLQVEALGKLEVQLDSSTLEGPLQSITDSDVDFRSIESTITWIEFPFSRIEFIQSAGKLLLHPISTCLISDIESKDLTVSAAFQVSKSPR